ncbi:MAG: hypothetical protein AB8U82_03345 [Rickettsia endosymbiont of Haemaphysalis japonica]
MLYTGVTFNLIKRIINIKMIQLRGLVKSIIAKF